MTNNIYFKPRTDKPKVVITDYDYGNINVESEILEAVGAEVIALQAKSEEDLFGVAPSCAAMINQYAKIGRKTISLMERCEVIARYGIGHHETCISHWQVCPNLHLQLNTRRTWSAEHREPYTAATQKCTYHPSSFDLISQLNQSNPVEFRKACTF